MANFNNSNFIKASDEETITLLKKMGYSVVSVSESETVFLNDKPIVFDSKPQDMIYTNILTY